jgi:alkanesulfonate monooxygenase SsuD/methylene tetrahydromethanopterin reductase-like flavin-dependent oxidoreductase (luciferase family)
VVPEWEPLAAVTAVAAAAERIRVGTLVLDAGLRDPVLITADVRFESGADHPTIGQTIL